MKKYVSAVIDAFLTKYLQLSNKDAEALAKFGMLMSSDKGYKNYRNRIHSINPPLIPYL